MTEQQLLLFVVILVIWIILAAGLSPWLPKGVVRRDLRIIGYAMLAALLLVSLLTAPSLILWLEYMSVVAAVLLFLFLYDRWVQRAAMP